VRILAADNYDDMSGKAAAIIISKVRHASRTVLGLATGGTPKATYEKLVQDHQKHYTSYQNVASFNLDEYVGLHSDDKNSYHYYMETHLFRGIDIPKDRCYLPDGLAEDIYAECRQYDELIDRFGGVDLQLLGIGENGHIGFNEPGTSFTSMTHVVDIEESTRHANARFFNDVSEVPTQAITMGIHNILQSREIVLLASGSSKAEAIARLFNEGIHPDFPASVLKNHRHVTVIADQDALSGVTMGEERAID
jgi:glucosamine-6-phosphate deaminase